jgi:hypothetical protein
VSTTRSTTCDKSFGRALLDFMTVSSAYAAIPGEDGAEFCQWSGRRMTSIG